MKTYKTLISAAGTLSTNIFWELTQVMRRKSRKGVWEITPGPEWRSHSSPCSPNRVLLVVVALWVPNQSSSLPTLGKCSLQDFPSQYSPCVSQTSITVPFWSFWCSRPPDKHPFTPSHILSERPPSQCSLVARTTGQLNVPTCSPLKWVPSLSSSDTSLQNMRFIPLFLPKRDPSPGISLRPLVDLGQCTTSCVQHFWPLPSPISTSFFGGFFALNR